MAPPKVQNYNIRCTLLINLKHDWKHQLCGVNINLWRTLAQTTILLAQVPISTDVRNSPSGTAPKPVKTTKTYYEHDLNYFQIDTAHTSFHFQLFFQHHGKSRKNFK